jgi:hypothetical protein
MGRGVPYRLRADNGLAAGLGAHARERAEGSISQDVDAAVVRLEIIDLLAEDEHPEVLAEELDDIESIRESRPIGRESAPPPKLALALLHLISYSAVRTQGLK